MHSAIDMNKVKPPNHKVLPNTADANGPRKRQIYVEKDVCDFITLQMKFSIIFATFVKLINFLLFGNYYSRVFCVFFEVIGLIGYTGTFVFLMELQLVYIVTHSLAVLGFYFVNLETVFIYAPEFLIPMLLTQPRWPGHLNEMALIASLFCNIVRFCSGFGYTFCCAYGSKIIVSNKDVEKFKKNSKIIIALSD